MDTYTFTIIGGPTGSRAVTVDIKSLSDDERTVLALIAFAPSKNGCITQRQIMESERWLGSHPQHETNLKNPEETTLRQVRAIIRKLRVTHHVPILSNTQGYWIPKDMKEVEEALSRLESTARAQARSWNETYRELSGCFNTAPVTFFERQEQLLKEVATV